MQQHLCLESFSPTPSSFLFPEYEKSIVEGKTPDDIKALLTSKYEEAAKTETSTPTEVEHVVPEEGAVVNAAPVVEVPATPVEEATTADDVIQTPTEASIEEKSEIAADIPITATETVADLVNVAPPTDC